MQQKHKGKISQVLIAINIIPMLFFGIVIIVVCFRWFSHIMYREVEQEMRNIAYSVQLLLDTAYPGDYALVGEEGYRLYKGESDITEEYALLDQIREDTQMEITLFYQDTRILTTIRSSSGERFIGTRAPEAAITNVLETGEARFFNKAIINNSPYFSYYMPARNADGNITGMIFVGKPSREVDASIQSSTYPLLFVTILAMAIIAVLIVMYTRRIVHAVLYIRSFLGEVATGNLNAELDPSVATRGDELGEIGRSAVSMQVSLRTMVEQDALTELFNRRSGNRKLKQIIQKSALQQTSFAVCIGDIDFFKKVNDTYGHDCGDLILKNVAKILQKHMRTCGFVARWGGEEFLLVFDRMNIEHAYEKLSETLDNIRAMVSEYDGHIIRVTMTFGLTAGDSDDMNHLLRVADERLYQGKLRGRNQIVWKDETENAVNTEGAESIDSTENTENLLAELENIIKSTDLEEENSNERSESDPADGSLRADDDAGILQEQEPQ